MTTTARATRTDPVRIGRSTTRPANTDPAYQAFWLMRIGFTVVPLLFGADKFAHVMVNWDKYLAPDLQRWLSPFATVHQTMYFVGVVEMAAGVIVLLLPRIGGYVVALWLAGIVVDLAILGGYGDVLMRDVALFLLALSFARLAVAYPAGAVSDRVLPRLRRTR